MHFGTLSLPAKLFLLAYHPDKGRFTGGPDLHLVVRAGALAELAQRGLLRDSGGTVAPVVGARTGDTVLDDLLDVVERSRPRKWRGWLTYRSRATLGAVRDQLAAHGYLRAERRRVLGVIPARRWELERTGYAEALHAEVLAVLRGPQPVEEVAERDAALVVCAAAGKLRPVVTGRDRRRHKDRLEALTDRSAGGSPELRELMGHLRKALDSAVAAAEIARSGGGGG